MTFYSRHKRSWRDYCKVIRRVWFQHLKSQISHKSHTSPDVTKLSPQMVWRFKKRTRECENWWLVKRIFTLEREYLLALFDESFPDPPSAMLGSGVVKDREALDSTAGLRSGGQTSSVCRAEAEMHHVGSFLLHTTASCCINTSAAAWRHTQGQFPEHFRAGLEIHVVPKRRKY